MNILKSMDINFLLIKILPWWNYFSRRTFSLRFCHSYWCRCALNYNWAPNWWQNQKKNTSSSPRKSSKQRWINSHRFKNNRKRSYIYGAKQANSWKSLLDLSRSLHASDEQSTKHDGMVWSRFQRFDGQIPCLFSSYLCHNWIS